MLSRISLRAKQWYFIAITHSTGRALGGGTSLKIYINGALVGSERLRLGHMCEVIEAWIVIVMEVSGRDECRAKFTV